VPESKGFPGFGPVLEKITGESFPAKVARYRKKRKEVDMIASKLTMVRRAGAAAAALLLAAPASAALIHSGGLTLDTDPDVFYQQSEIAPCVIGPANCLNLDGFQYTLAGAGGAGSVFERTSPLYPVSVISVLLPSGSFSIGLDFNQSAQAQTLYEFEVRYFNGGGTLIGAQTFDEEGGTVLQVHNNGVGWSDFLLSSFEIAHGATHVEFFASWFNNSGGDRFFLVAQSENAVSVPAPAPLALMGLGLVGVALIRRRRSAIRPA
jgi:hypothetical protein